MYKFPLAAALAVSFLIAGCATRSAPPVPIAQTAEPPMTSEPTVKLNPEDERALLSPYRAKIDALDSQIVALLGQRFDVVRDVAALKAEHGIAPILPDRIEQVVQHARAKAEKAGVDPKLVEQIYRIMIDAACRLEEDYSHAHGAKAS